jgi:hypothetical protein
VFLDVGCGSTNTKGTAGAWASAFYAGVTGGTNVVATNGATFQFTGVQLEVGSTATSFDYRPYGTELMLCQRYYYVNNGGSGGISYMPLIGDNYRQMLYLWPVTMRSSPTVTATYSGGSPTGSQFTNINSTNVYTNAGNTSSTLFLVTINATAEL